MNRSKMVSVEEFRREVVVRAARDRKRHEEWNRIYTDKEIEEIHASQMQLEAAEEAKLLVTRATRFAAAIDLFVNKAIEIAAQMRYGKCISYDAAGDSEFEMNLMEFKDGKESVLRNWMSSEPEAWGCSELLSDDSALNRLKEVIEPLGYTVSLIEVNIILTFKYPSISEEEITEAMKDL